MTMTNTPEQIEGMVHVPNHGYVPQPDIRIDQLETAVLELSHKLQSTSEQLAFVVNDNIRLYQRIEQLEQQHERTP